MHRVRFALSLASSLLIPVLAGCGQERVPPPKAAFDAYVAAAQRGDDVALHGMMTEESRTRLGREGTARAVGDAKAELADLAAQASAKDASWRTDAHVLLEGGDTATLLLEGGVFRVTGVDGLPLRAKTPEEALFGLRRALLRSRLESVALVLTKTQRDAVSKDVAGLVSALSHPAALDTRITGDKAVTTTPNGHLVRLRREGGLWKIEDFD